MLEDCHDDEQVAATWLRVPVDRRALTAKDLDTHGPSDLLIGHTVAGRGPLLHGFGTGVQHTKRKDFAGLGRSVLAM